MDRSWLVSVFKAGSIQGTASKLTTKALRESPKYFHLEISAGIIVNFLTTIAHRL